MLRQGYIQLGNCGGNSQRLEATHASSEPTSSTLRNGSVLAEVTLEANTANRHALSAKLTDE